MGSVEIRGGGGGGGGFGGLGPGGVSLLGGATSRGSLDAADAFF